jgi:hypothetical protein
MDEVNIIPGEVGGKRDSERRTLALAFARRLNGTAVQCDEVLHDREPESEPAEPRGGGIALSEPLEDMGEKGRRNTPTGVAYGDRCTLRVAVESHST